jgi:hypothetical protein
MRSHQNDDGLDGGVGRVCDPAVGVRLVIFGYENFAVGVTETEGHYKMDDTR